MRLSRGLQITLCLVFLVAGAAPQPAGASPAGQDQPPEAAQMVPAGFSDNPVATFSSPTALAFSPAPNPKLFVTRQGGQIEVLNLDGTKVSDALDIGSQICSDWERGLLGIDLDPAFATNRFAYIFANFGGCNNANDGRVIRYTVANDWTFTSPFTVIDNIPSIAGNHNGGDIAFGKDGRLYITVGDSGTGGGLADDLNTLAGKILRISADGSVPTDNPFYNNNGAAVCGDADGVNGASVCREIFAYGLRNPFRFAMDPNAAATRFLINDVGQGTWEEISESAPGANYGWPTREGPCPISDNCTPSLPSGNGFTDPIHWYGRTVGGSITGGAFVPNGSGWPNEYAGAYLFGDYVSGRVFRLNRTSTTGTNQWTRTDFITGLGSSSAVHLEFGPGADGTGIALYYTNYQGGGQIRRVTYASAGTPPSAALTAAPTQGAAPLTVNFDASGSTGTAPLSYSWNFGNGQTTSGNATRSFTYTSPGVFTATVTVTNTLGTSTAQRVIQVGTPPTATITQPGNGATFTVGAQIGLQGSATNSQGQTLPASALNWEVRLHHVDETNPTTRHFHPFFNRTGQATASFAAPAPEDLRAARFSYLEVRLTATDSLGLSTTITREVRPQVVMVGFGTQPGGAIVNVSDTVMSLPVNNAALYSWPGWTITATVSSQIVNGQRLIFDRWSDGNRNNPRAFMTGATAITHTVELRPAGYVVFLPRIGR